MHSSVFLKIIGAIALLLIAGGYILLWVPVDAPLSEVITRTRMAIFMNLFGCIMVIYYLYKR